MRVLLFSLLALSIMPSFAQNSDAYFRRLPFGTEPTPAWAELMYSTDPNVFEVQEMRRTFWQGREYEKNIHERNYKTWLGHVESMLDERGMIRPNAAAVTTEQPGTRGGDLWTPIGPFDTYNLGTQGSIPVSWQCNVYTMDVCQTNPDVLYAGVEGGDLFKTTDRGFNWFPITEGLGIRTVSRVAVAPSDENLVYFESGGNLYKSTNGGSVWSTVYSPGETATAIAIHPTNPSIVLFATFDALYRTTNGGMTWSTIYSERVWDAVFHATDPSIVFIAKRNTTAKRAELFKSTDTGASFTLKDSGWFVPSDLPNADDQGALIGVTPADPNRVYVALIGRGKGSDTGWIGMYKSTDAGETWSNPIGQDGAPYNATTAPSLATSSMDGTGIYQGYYDFVIAVSHNDADKVWIGVTGFSQSNDGGNSWTRIGGYGAGGNDIGWIHPDMQEMCVAGNDIWLSTDGGINYSNDEFASHESRKYGIYNSDFWGYGQGWNYDIQVGGRYHNGNTGYYQTYTPGNHLRLGGAEAPTGYVDPFLERQAYFSDISDLVLPEQFTDPVSGGRALSTYPQSAYWDSESSEVLFHPNYADMVYMGQGDAFLKSTDGGLNFSPTFTFPSGSLVFELESPRDNPDVFYAVVRTSGSCNVWKSTDGGVTFSNLGHPGSTMYKMEIAVNHYNANELWVIHANGTQVHKTTNGGLSWSNQYEGTFSGQQFRDIQCLGDGNALVVTSTHVYSKASGDAFWSAYEAGLPSRINTLNCEPFYRDGLIRMCDKGKGIWEAEIPFEIPPVADPMVLRSEVYCVQDTVQLDCHSILNHAGATWTWAISPAPVYVSDLNSRNPKVVLGAEGSYDVTLTIQDGLGNTSQKTIPSMLQAMSSCAVEGLPGGSLECQVNGDYAFTEDLNLTTNTLTITAWVKPNGIQGEYTGILMSEDGDAAGFNFRPGNELAYHWPGGAWWWSSGLIVPEDQWSYVAMVATPTAMKVYLNGVEAVHTTALTATDIHRMTIGSYRGWSGRNLNGLIDEVRIWNRALTQNEIREMRHLTLDQTYLDTDPDLLVYYQFNEDVPYLINKKNIPVHGTLNGGAQLNPLGSAVGAGQSDRVLVNGPGTYTFANTESEVSFPAAGVPGGEVVITRWDGPPTHSPDENRHVNSHFVVNNYGATPAMAPVSFLVSPSNYSPQLAVQSGFADLEVYTRWENGTDEAWSIHCNAVGTDPAAIDLGCNPSLDAQFMLLEPYCQETVEALSLCLPESAPCTDCVTLEGIPSDPVTEAGTYYAEDLSSACPNLTVHEVEAFGPFTLSWTSEGAVVTATLGYDLYTFSLEGEILQSGPSNTLTVTAAGNLTVEISEGPCSASYTAALECYGDVNGDLAINVSDLLEILGSFGCTMDCGPADITGDGQVNSSDVLAVLGAFGTLCD